MSARRLFDTDVPVAPMRLFAPADEPGETGIVYPGLATGSSSPVFSPQSRPSDVYSIFREMQSQHQEDRPELSTADAELARTQWPLSVVYDRAIAEWRMRQLARGEIKPGTLEKERQSVRCFGAWDSHQQPDNWPAGHIWTGLPVSYLGAHYIERWVEDRLREGMASGTMASRWCHLRTVINVAVRLRVIDATPKVDLTPIHDSHAESAADDGEDDDDSPIVYTTNQLEEVYHALAGQIDLQAAWVLGANVGPRAGDLFGMRWHQKPRSLRIDLDAPEVFYTAQKTGKKHWCPLAPCVVNHLRRLIQSQGHLNPQRPEGLVFPRLTSGNHKKPEKSAAARRRTDRIKDVLRSMGLKVDHKSDDHFHPWQVLRRTATSRLNNHRSGKGQLVTHGKDADVNSQSYWNERPAITEAVMSLPQPAAFRSLD